MMALSDFPFTARSVRVAALTRRSVAVEGTVQLVTRSSVSLSHRCPFFPHNVMIRHTVPYLHALQ